MKNKLFATLLIVMGFMTSSWAQVMTVCTPEQIEASKYRQKACEIQVRDTASQQLQTHYQQLATYYQQLDKDNQQKAKDAQQVSKDKQQIDKDKQQWECDKALCERTAALNCANERYDELKCFIEVVMPLLDGCGNLPIVNDVKKELKRIHTNRSGGGDGTNPGGGGNIRGFDNPGFLISRQ